MPNLSQKLEKNFFDNAFVENITDFLSS